MLPQPPRLPMLFNYSKSLGLIMGLRLRLFRLARNTQIILAGYFWCLAMCRPMSPLVQFFLFRGISFRDQRIRQFVIFLW